MNFQRFVFFLSLLSIGCLPAVAQSVPDLLKQGKILLDENKVDSALMCYQRILSLDDKNYEALAFLCNYHYLLGQQALDKIELVYMAHESPTRMQVAQFKGDLLSLYKDYFSKAEQFLIRAYLIRPNDQLDALAGQIADFKERIGIRTPEKKSMDFIKKLFP